VKSATLVWAATGADEAGRAAPAPDAAMPPPDTGAAPGTGQPPASGDAAHPAAPGAKPSAAPKGATGAMAAMGATGGMPSDAAQAATPATPAAPPVSDAERALLLDLRHRREALDDRARELDQRSAVVGAAETKLSSRVDQLSALQSRLEQLDNDRKAHDEANWTGLVHVYETMKPRDAAVIFDALDMQVLLAVMDRMQPRRVAPILAAMQPDRARLATQMLAELRTKSVTPASGQAAVPAPATVPKG
jgi:flagellar motility protein MotE (MotC chaperone)